jgi:flagellar basal-body rod protein FlgB
MLGPNPTAEILARALDVCALKQSVYSANIANANVNGYRRLEVVHDADFARLEAEVIRASAVPRSAPAETPQVVTTDVAVKLDEEMALMARNALRYQTLLDAYDRASSIMKLAVHEGRSA